MSQRGVTLLGVLAASLWLAAATGCESDGTVSSGYTARVTMDGDPIQDLEVRVHVPAGGSTAGPVVLRGITGPNGSASLLLEDGADAPASGEEVGISLEAVSDGSWTINRRFADPQTSELQRALPAEGPLEIELPAGALSVL
jgi:hypothetical protein